MTKPYYRPSKEEDCFILAPNLRHQDSLEVSYSVGLSNEKALLTALELSRQECNSIIYKDTVIGMFGVGVDPEDKQRGIPWLLASDSIFDIQRTFIRESKKWVNSISQDYYLLYNYVHIGNRPSIKWLKFLGFHFIRLIPDYGVGKKPFYEFVKICATQPFMPQSS
tara:strand:+ start:90 stop:587 length:498 start_codon:yes stop_codon:yes gene_type:complete